MNDHTQSTGHEPAPPPALLPLAVFGRDDAGKAHASRFEATHAALAEKAAGLMGMRVLRLATPEHQTLGAKLPAGRVFESGRAFVPFVKGALFEQLDATAEAFTPARPTDAEVPAPPAPRKAKGARSAQGADKPSGDTEKAAKELAAPPTDPTMIAVGHIVLAAEENALEVWYLATVIALKGPSLLQLQWAGEQYAAEPPIVRHRDHLALLPSAIAVTLK